MNGTATARYSLIGDNTGATITNNGGNQIGTGGSPINPLLGPLADNAGLTLTHALLAGSPGIDAGDPAFSSPPTNDQRGTPFVRVADGDGTARARVDIGAYERQTIAGSFFIVDTLTDENDGNYSTGDLSLREAIRLANGSASDETITFAASLTSGGPATINLTSLGDLVITDSVAINGPGANLLSIRAFDPTSAIKNGDGRRVFNIDNGDSGLIDVVIVGLTLTGADIFDIAGGAIRSLENLAIRDSVITGNAIMVLDSNGGGVASFKGALTIERTTISGNFAGNGGGVFVGGGNVTLNVTDSTISGNQARFDGGGINGYSASAMNVVGSTISENRAGRFGGGIVLKVSNLFVRHSTISANRTVLEDIAEFAGGGLRLLGIDNSVTLNHVIVAGNIRETVFGTTRDDINGQVTAHFSLIGDNSDATIAPGSSGNLIGTFASPIDPVLGPLADSGGPTMTHALLAGSPAIDAGDPAAVAGVGDVPLLDQRGSPNARVSGGRIDIGAFEVQVAGPVLPGDYNQNNEVDAADYVVWRFTLGDSVLAPFDGADGDGDGEVDPDDYGVWVANFGRTLGAGAKELRVKSQESRAGALAEQVTPATSAETALADFDELSRVEPAAPGETRALAEPLVRSASIPHLLDNSRPLPRGEVVSVARYDDALVAWLAGRATAHRHEDSGAGSVARDEAVDDSADSSCAAVDAVFEQVAAGL